MQAVGGHRTDLCKNESLVFKLQRLLEPEYRAQAVSLLFVGSKYGPVVWALALFSLLGWV